MTQELATAASEVSDLMEFVDSIRRRSAEFVNDDVGRALGQVFTPSAVASLMAGMLRPRRGAVSILDPGAGIGSLAAAAVLHYAASSPKPDALHVVAYEIDARLLDNLTLVLKECQSRANQSGIGMTFDVRNRDFLKDAAEQVAHRQAAAGTYDAAILNPPYGKLNSDSAQRTLGRSFGVEAPNTYAAFMAASIRLTHNHGDVVAITPRSFCNGSYFKRFREFLLSSGAIRHLHVFDARDRAFSEQGVLQENLITHLAVKEEPADVLVTAQLGPGSPVRGRSVPFKEIVLPHDKNRFIRVILDAVGKEAALLERLRSSIEDLGIVVSTGPVVDFRAAELLRQQPEEGCVPLIWSSHFYRGKVRWPVIDGRKPNAIRYREAAARHLLVPNGDYTLVRRFSAKEETRRIVAVFFEKTPTDTAIGLENHLNYFHAGGHPLDRWLALGLVSYLNSSFVDGYFRQFSGHTQVNASDLRSLPYPSRELLVQLGNRVDEERLSDTPYVDQLLQNVVLGAEVTSS